MWEIKARVQTACLQIKCDKKTKSQLIVTYVNHFNTNPKQSKWTRATNRWKDNLKEQTRDQARGQTLHSWLHHRNVWQDFAKEEWFRCVYILRSLEIKPEMIGSGRVTAPGIETLTRWLPVPVMRWRLISGEKSMKLLVWISNLFFFVLSYQAGIKQLITNSLTAYMFFKEMCSTSISKGSVS